jgi:hypothetical protein
MRVTVGDCITSRPAGAACLRGVDFRPAASDEIDGEFPPFDLATQLLYWARATVLP